MPRAIHDWQTSPHTRSTIVLLHLINPLLHQLQLPFLHSIHRQTLYSMKTLASKMFIIIFLLTSWKWKTILIRLMTFVAFEIHVDADVVVQWTNSIARDDFERWSVLFRPNGLHFFFYFRPCSLMNRNFKVDTRFFHFNCLLWRSNFLADTTFGWILLVQLGNVLWTFNTSGRLRALSNPRVG